MNDLEQTLPTQLRHLADDLAPHTDPVAQAGAARARHRRQRRTRVGIAGLAAAVAAIVIGVPTTMGALSSAPEPGGQVAGPGPRTPTEEDAAWAASSAARDAREAEAARSAAEQASAQAAAQEAALAARIALVADSLAGRDPSLELRAGTDLSCPDHAPVDGAVRAEQGAGLVDGCRWSAPGLTLALSLTEGQDEEEMVREVDVEVARGDCTVQAMPSTVDVTPLTLCPTGQDDRTVWTLRVPDSGGAGYWVLSAAEEPGASTDAGAGGLLSLVDLAAQQW
ncbi:hypothetical protein [Modestobacter roseus]|uniref:hypothetical protein n=1 Tax=Modestobacter roseus TaxID=1181884 RepID=UPI0034DEB1C7